MKRRDFLSLAALAGMSTGTRAAYEVACHAIQPGTAAAGNKPIRDRLRPVYHLLPESGFVGDPRAPRFFNGRYHVFSTERRAKGDGIMQ
jgi:sucrose-6-phosphate hydrolase SacC (GH32 family)